MTLQTSAYSRICACSVLALGCFPFNHALAQRVTYTLGASELLVGPTAGSSSVTLKVTPEGSSWKVATDATWLHLSPENESGTGSTNIIFSYDTNPSATCFGTVTIGDQKVHVTQAASSYVESRSLALLTSVGESLSGIAMDKAGNLYIADNLASVVYQLTATDHKLIPLISGGLLEPYGLAVDGANNLYVADTFNNAIKKWSPVNNTMIVLASQGLNHPQGVAVDSAGNVYIADSGNDAIKKWSITNGAVTTLVSAGLSGPAGIAVDAADNLYIADTKDNAVKKWTAANNGVSPLAITGLLNPTGITVDPRGNVYIADTLHNAIKKWAAADGTMATLATEVEAPSGLALDGANNIYIADSNNQAIKRLAYAFIDPTAISEHAAAGNDVLPPILPLVPNLLAQSPPFTDAPWLKITGVTNGMVGLSFGVNSGDPRTANLILLGQTIPITQAGTGVSTNAAEAPTPTYTVSPNAFSNTQGATFPVLATTNTPAAAPQ